MSILEKLERKFPWFGFNNLNLYMVVIFLIGLAINIIHPLFYYFNLSLDVVKVLSGQIWRLITFIFFPPSSGGSVILSLLMIFVYYSITKTLIIIWGNFKFNLYLFIGWLSQILGAFLTYFLLGRNVIFYPIYTIFSLIMAFALSFPDAYFMIYFLIPLKAKYFAYLELGIYVLSFLFSNYENRIAIICSAINVFVYFVLLKKH